MKKYDIKYGLSVLKNYIGLLISIVNPSNRTNNQQCMTQPTLTNLHQNKQSQGLRYSSFAFNLYIYVLEVVDALDGFSNRVCVPNETEGLSMHIFNIIIRINESKI